MNKKIEGTIINALAELPRCPHEYGELKLAKTMISGLLSEGFVIVPKDPTDGMIYEGNHGMDTTISDIIWTVMVNHYIEFGETK